MIRDIITIDEEKCDGCGECIPACHEGAIQLVDGKARLVADTICDGMGACLGHCPQGALRVERREAQAFDPAEVEAHIGAARPAPLPAAARQPIHHGGCPGSAARQLLRISVPATPGSSASSESALMSWPVKLQLMNPKAPYLHRARLLVAADCVPVAFAAFQQQMLRGRIPVIACPKFDDLEQHVDRLTAIVSHNELSEIAVVRMVVPCCAGIVMAVREAVRRAGSAVRLTEVTVGLEGQIMGEGPMVITQTAKGPSIRAPHAGLRDSPDTALER